MRKLLIIFIILLMAQPAMAGLFKRRSRISYNMCPQLQYDMCPKLPEKPSVLVKDSTKVETKVEKKKPVVVSRKPNSVRTISHYKKVCGPNGCSYVPVYTDQLNKKAPARTYAPVRWSAPVRRSGGS
jgi:hypothetical protein